MSDATERRAAPPVGIHDPRVLVVEDDPLNQRVTTMLLETLGFRVDLVATGADAVEAAARYRYTTIVMDIEMPGMDGLDATAEIRRTEGVARRTPIIALTTLELEGGIAAFLAAGMDDRCKKPVSLDELKRALTRCGVAVPTSERRGEGGVVAPPTPPSPAAVVDPLRLAELVGASSDPACFLSELVHLFHVDVGAQLTAMQQAATCGASELLADLANVLGQSCAMLGATRMTALCQDLAAPTDWNDRVRVDGVLERLHAERERVCAALTARRSAAIGPE